MQNSKILKSFIILFFFCSFSFAQYYEESGYSGVGLPFFDFSLNRQFNNDFTNSHVIIVAQVLYDDLTFVTSEQSGYEAELEWLIAVYSDDDKMIFSRSVTKQIKVADFGETNSRTDKIILKDEIPLKPGEYKVLLRTVDLTTNQSAQKTMQIEIPNYYDENISISDILFLNSVKLDSAGMLKDYEPILGENFTIKDGEFYIYFNVYSEKINLPVKINYKFNGSKNKTEFDSLTSKLVKANITSHILKIDKNMFKENKYEINIKVTVDGNSSETSKNITFFWKSVPHNSFDLNLALNQMVYIINPDSLSFYLEAELTDKQAYFKKFWAQRDPDPKTKKNELMDEYFKRINYANEHFSGLSNHGWTTDRGRILIKFGHPEDIERHPFELETRPYEVWRYYSLRKIFLFEDHTGFGDFRLHPEYISVEYQ
ncbi:MAG: GWxTD domain-containing protein [Calditrichaeota bacterium]|nr:MAG: hypothetical protein DWQ03_03440 [Calditrichota bacterium]MBL1204458.1 GWxTD domain-containing protein [Calditrichota bacterium]NOG44287.1 GWxTD domain-containing protein [Calditrichota bacterium]